MIYEITDTDSITHLFGNWQESVIWSCLQGVMGKIYANDTIQPTAAMAILGDFAYYASEPDMELIAYKPAQCTKSMVIMVPQNEAWTKAIVQHYQDKANVISRYMMKKEPGIFDKAKLEMAVAALPSAYKLRMIDEQLYHRCKAEEWCADLVAQFPTYEEYRRLGLGTVILIDDQIVSGVSSYSRYREGIEIEADTRQDHRHWGLAYICGAKLILECLKRDLYPSWDAQNQISVALAEKLGYHYSHTYTAIEVTW